MNIDWQPAPLRFQQGYRDAYLDPGLRRARNELFKTQGREIQLQRALDEGRLNGLQDQFYRMPRRAALARMGVPTAPHW